MRISILYAALTAILFATLEPVSKLISSDVNPFAITFWRFLFGTAILFPFALARAKKNKLKIAPKDIVGMSLLGILFVAISMVCLQVGVKISDSPSLIAIIFSSNSIFTIIFAIIILNEKMTKYKAAAIVLGIIGVLFCTDMSHSTNTMSVLLALVAAITFSFYTVIARRYSVKFGGMVQSSIVFIAGSIALLIALIAIGIDISVPLNIKTIGVLAYLSVAVTGMGYACYFSAMEKGGVIMASMAFFIKPILTPFVTWIVNGIAPDVKVFAAVLCIVAASVLASKKKKA